MDFAVNLSLLGPADYAQAASLARLLYPHITEQVIADKQEKGFTPRPDCKSRQYYCVKAPDGQMASLGRLTIIPNKQFQAKELIVKDGGDQFNVVPYSEIMPTDRYEISVNELVVNPSFSGRKIGTRMAELLLSKAMETPGVVTIAAHGPYSTEQMGHVLSHIRKNGSISVSDLKSYGVGELPYTRPQSIGTERAARQLGMIEKGAAPEYGCKVFFKEDTNGKS